MSPLWYALAAAVIVYLIVGPLFDVLADRASDDDDAGSSLFPRERDW
jgi:hypothetical protein